MGRITKKSAGPSWYPLKMVLEAGITGTNFDSL